MSEPADRTRATGAKGFETFVRQVDFASAQHLSLSVELQLQPTFERLDVEAKSQPFRDQLDMSEVRESPAKDVGEALTAVDGVYRIRQAGIANDVVVRGFQQGNVNVLIDGARLYGACTGHMDPAATTSISLKLNVWILTKMLLMSPVLAVSVRLLKS